MKLARRAALSAVTVGLFCAAAVEAVHAQDQDMADYFADQTITIISGGTPGGPTDTTARLFAQYAVKHFPGNPTFIVESLPGGGQLRALQAGMRARPDGFTAAVAHTRWAIGSILGADLSPYDVRTARFVGSPLAAQRVGLICADRDKFESWQAILDSGQPLQIGAELGARNILGATLVDLLDGPIESVYGYDGTSESAAAFDRGEVAGVACADDTVPDLYPEWFENKRLTPLFYWGPDPDPAYLELIGSPEQPVHVLDLPGVTFTEEAKRVLQVAQDMYLFTSAIVLPAETPDDVYEAWRDAYAATIRDPEYMAASKAAALETGLGTTDAFAETLSLAQSLSPEGLDLLRQVMGAE